MSGRTKLIAAALIAGLGASQLALGQSLPLTNRGEVNPSSWIYGPRNDDTTGVIWNPARLKMMNGEDVVGRTMSFSNDVATMNSRYCALASESHADFTWTEMQHSGIDWGDAWRMWNYASSTNPDTKLPNCPGLRAIPGTRIAYTDEREIQHALDGGAMVLVVPTVDTAEEAKEVVQWAYFPPFGRRSAGGSQTAAVLGRWMQGQNYRRTFNNNLVLIVMLETIEAVKNAEAIARVPGVHGVFAASGDLGNFSGYQEGDADYEKLITTVGDATLKAGKRLCGPFRWNNRPGFTCFQD
jgi:4-hydroxy-2-oxoheptanedioate aldolase